MWKTLEARAYLAFFGLAIPALGAFLFFLFPRMAARHQAPTTEKVAALSFDDGPNPPYTERILDLLDRYGVRATFFFIGRNIEMHRNAALQVVQRGHEIGNHSYSHHRLGFVSPSKAREEIERTDESIRSLGYRGEIPFRAPFGETTLLVWWALRSLGRGHYLYSVPPTPADYFRPDPELLVEQTLRRIHPGAVLLFHDGEGIRTETCTAIERLLPALKEQGYRFATVTELFKDPHRARP